MEDLEVESVVNILTADYERQGQEISSDHVNKVLSKRNLSISQTTAILEKLEATGIIILSAESDELDSLNSLSLSNEKSEYDFEREKELERKTNLLGGKLLSAEEEVKLGRTIRLGVTAKEELDSGISRTSMHIHLINNAKTARDLMIKKNLRLVLHVARKYQGHSVLSIDDLFQEGIFGLIRSIEKFDYTLGYKFSTYAIWWIRQSITRALADKGATIRIPVYLHLDVMKLIRAEKLLENNSPTKRVTVQALADELNWEVEKVHFLSQVNQITPISIDHLASEKSDYTFQETFVSLESSPDDIVDSYTLSREINFQLEKLNERERDILKSRFGLKDFGEGETLEEIGTRYGLTRERIRQIESKALEKFRKPSMSRSLEVYIEADNES